MPINIIENTPGHVVSLKTSRNRHITDTVTGQYKGDKVSEGFKDAFFKAIGNVNSLEQKANELTTKMATDPDSVEIHDVMIAASQAEMAVAFTKAVADRVIRAYKEITSIR